MPHEARSHSYFLRFNLCLYNVQVQFAEFKRIYWQKIMCLLVFNHPKQRIAVFT